MPVPYVVILNRRVQRASLLEQSAVCPDPYHFATITSVFRMSGEMTIMFKLLRGNFDQKDKLRTFPQRRRSMNQSVQRTFPKKRILLSFSAMDAIALVSTQQTRCRINANIF